jgi:outer membrane protein OmpA-like peptidoglycan-associated protein
VKPFKIKHLFVLGLSVFALEAFAQKQWECRSFTDVVSGQERFEPCAYIGFGLGISRLNPEEKGTSWQEVDKNDGGYKIYAGYQFTERWFAEAHYADLGEVEMKSANPNFKNEHIYYKAPAVFAGYYLPVESWLDTSLPFDVFTKVGASFLRTGAESKNSNLLSEERTSLQLALGIGLERQFATRWMARAEFEAFDEDAKLFSVSIGYWFGKTKTYQKPEPVKEEPKPEPVVVAVVEPEPVPVVAEPKMSDEACRLFSGSLSDVNFKPNSTELSSNAKLILHGVVGILNDYPDLTFEVRAHTDSVGSDAVNQKLSDNRAISVRQFLIDSGVDAARLTAKGYGEKFPVGDNKTKEGRAKNRRVELHPLQDTDCDN